jgi:hypothetical protein
MIEYSFFCMHGEKKCKKGKLCNFAHNIEELQPTSCKWAEECKRHGCTYKHDYETKEEYIARVFQKEIKRLGIVLNVIPKKHIVKTNINFMKDIEEIIKNSLIGYIPKPFTENDMIECRNRSWADIYDEDCLTDPSLMAVRKMMTC